MSSEHLSTITAKDGEGGAKIDNIDQANSEIDRLRKSNEKLQGELQGKRLELINNFSEKQNVLNDETQNKVLTRVNIIINRTVMFCCSSYEDHLPSS